MGSHSKYTFKVFQINKPDSTFTHAFAKFKCHYINKCGSDRKSYIHKATRFPWLLNADTTFANKSFIDSVKYLSMLNECHLSGVHHTLRMATEAGLCHEPEVSVFDLSACGCLPCPLAFLSGDLNFGCCVCWAQYKFGKLWLKRPTKETTENGRIVEMNECFVF